MKIRKALFFLAILGLTTLIPSLHAQAASVPYVFTSGTTASAAQVNADFAALAKYLPAIGYSQINYSGTLNPSAWVSIGSKTATFPANGYAIVTFSGIISCTFVGNQFTMDVAASTSQTPSPDFQIITDWRAGDMAGWPSIGFIHKIITPVTAGNSTFYALVNNSINGPLVLPLTINGILQIEYFPNSL